MRKIFALLTCMILALPAHAGDLELDIQGGTFNPLPIGIPQFAAPDAGLTPMAQQITDVIVTDLVNSGLFSVVDQKAYLQNARDVMAGPRFADWRLINAEALLGGIIQKTGNQIQVDFRIFDVITESQLEGLSLSGDEKNWRRIAHKIADAVYERLTGDPGYFDSKVVYVAEHGPEDKRVTRLAIMDYDGEGHQFLTSGSTYVMTPAISPDGKKIAYTDWGMNGKDHSVYVFDLATGKNHKLFSKHGTRSGLRFSPDGQHLLIAISENGATTINKFHLHTKKLTKLTSSSGSIDTTPDFSPDGSKIIYASDRSSRRAKIYIKGLGEGEGERITFDDASYQTPVWSPRGDMVAFTKLKGGKFYIGVMRTDGSGERMIATNYLVEGVTWSPNGRALMFTSQAGSKSPKKLHMIDIVGFNERTVDIPGEGSAPAWTRLND